MKTTYDNMSITRRWINATDCFDHALKNQDHLNRAKCAKRGSRALLFHYALTAYIDPEREAFHNNRVVDQLWAELKAAFTPPAIEAAA